MRWKESDVEGIVLQLLVSGECEEPIKLQVRLEGDITCLPIMPIQAMEGVAMVVGSGNSRPQRQRYLIRERQLS